MKKLNHAVPVLAVVALVLGACGGGATPQPAAESAAPAEAAAPAAEPLDTAKFATVLPEGWEIAADDLESMGMMTITRKNSGDKGVYLKFEG
ncbi:MAG TPA: hypothetical protein VLA66_09305, partial [Thermoanaerobaculia bacterium]|nr:hypothetical protein [Thermoanaerobaculia bacterium]